jgi:hypothetical protein
MTNLGAFPYPSFPYSIAFADTDAARLCQQLSKLCMHHKPWGTSINPTIVIARRHGRRGDPGFCVLWIATPPLEARNDGLIEVPHD